MIVDDLGIDIDYIPYDGAANVRVAALAGDISFGSCTFGNVLNDVAEGTYKGLLVTSPTHFDAVPDLELASEAGAPSANDNGVWRAFFCPSRYDEATINYISELLDIAKGTDAWAKIL